MSTESAARRNDWSLPLLGLLLLTLAWLFLIVIVLPEWKVNHDYLESRCVVLEKRLAKNVGRRAGRLCRPEFLIRYTVAAAEHEVWAYDAVGAYDDLWSTNRRILDQFTVGQDYPCWYDPADPSQVVLVHGYSPGSYLVVAVIVLLALLTGKGIYSRLQEMRLAQKPMEKQSLFQK
jgi:hypothetical protein